MEDGRLLKGKREIVEKWLVSQMLNQSQPTKLSETQHRYSHHISTDLETVNKEVTALAKKKKKSLYYSRSLFFHPKSFNSPVPFGALLQQWRAFMGKEYVKEPVRIITSQCPFEYLPHSVITFFYSIPSLLAVSLSL